MSTTALPSVLSNKSTAEAFSTVDLPARPITSASALSSANITSPSDAKPDAGVDAADPLISSASPTASLWLQSRLLSSAPAVYRPHGEDRPFTISNVKLAARLVGLFWKRFLAIFSEGVEWRLMALVGGKVIRGFLPTLKIWASSKMLDIVQKSFEVGSAGVGPNEVLHVALIAMFCSTGDQVMEYLLNDNDVLVRVHIDRMCKRAYLASQLSLPISTPTSSYVTPLVWEAGIITGTNGRIDKDGNEYRFAQGRPSNCLLMILNLFTEFVGIFSQLYLMYQTLSGGSSVGWSSFLLIGMSVAPTLLRMIGNLYRSVPKRIRKGNPHFDHYVADESLQNMASKGTHKQETILYGLAAWVLARWDMLQDDKERLMWERRMGGKGWELGVDIAGEGVQTSFQVLLALKVLPTTLSLGSIRLYQHTVESLLRSLRTLHKKTDEVFQLIFYLAAFTEMVELPNKPHLLRTPAYRDAPLLNFDDHRIAAGMSLVAKDLSFWYPGTDRNILNKINLTIEAGSTLAIVGLNGSGKTTLIKSLLGLYDDHEGTLTLNGHPLASYDPASVHRRTACLFQDFAQYSFTLRENVGIGNVGLMADDEAVTQAIVRGGADGVLGKVGIDGKLQRWELSKSAKEDVEITKEKTAVVKIAKLGVRQRAMKALVGVVEGVMGGLGRWYGGNAVELKAGLRSGLEGIDTPFLSDNKVDPSPTSPANDTNGTSDLPAADPTSANPKHTSEPKSTIDSNQSACLSIGQWQRVALSRAFLRAKDADLVIFDEPSASLDPKAESELFERINALSHQDGRSCTTIYISHRFSTVRRADQIAVVENGSIIECGDHASLLGQKGRYAELYNISKAGFED